MSCFNKTITSEFVSFGHPDKIADQIADAILDEFLKHDSNARCGIEVMVKDNVVVLGGEVNSIANNNDINYDYIVRNVYDNIPFPTNHGLNSDNIKIINLIGKQSSEIHNGVDKSEEDIGAGDQGFAVGYANNETDVYMPLGHYVAKTLCQYVATHNPNYGPDVKTQVVVDYDNSRNAKIVSILVSTMHKCDLSQTRNDIENIIRNNQDNYLPVYLYDKYIKDKDFKIDVNPCGAWNIGGPVSDCGVTGRKLVVDAYGGYCNIGGGAQCGKDFSKVDRSAAYMCRYLAKNIVASGIASEAKVELSYMIGVAQPIAININMYPVLNDVDPVDLRNLVKDYILKNIDLTPKGIMRRFKHDIPRNYQNTVLGLFGYNTSSYEDFTTYVDLFPWEDVDFANDLKQHITSIIK